MSWFVPGMFTWMPGGKGVGGFSSTGGAFSMSEVATPALDSSFSLWPDTYPT